MDLITSFILFTFVGSLSPGPNNLMVMASTANYGYRKTLPHVIGILLGSSSMLLLVAGGIADTFDEHPQLHQYLQWVGMIYLSYLAFRMARTSKYVQGGGECGKPLTVLQATLFQWVNPKSWTLALTTITLYLPEYSAQAIIIIILAFWSVAIPSLIIWMLLGGKISTFFDSADKFRIFNVVMALLLICAMAPVLLLNAPFETA